MSLDHVAPFRQKLGRPWVTLRPRFQPVGLIVFKERFLDWIQPELTLQDPRQSGGMTSDVRTSHDGRIANGRFARLDAVDEITRMSRNIKTADAFVFLRQSAS